MAHGKLEWHWEVIKQIWADKIMTLSTAVLESFSVLVAKFTVCAQTHVVKKNFSCFILFIISSVNYIFHHKSFVYKLVKIS
jgi:hypothetical protein